MTTSPRIRHPPRRRTPHPSPKNEIRSRRRESLTRLAQSHPTFRVPPNAPAPGSHLLTWNRETLRARGEKRDWKTPRHLLSTHSLVTSVLPLRDGRVLRVRKPSLPDPEQALVDQHPGIPLRAAFPPVKFFAEP